MSSILAGEAKKPIVLLSAFLLNSLSKNTSFIEYIISFNKHTYAIGYYANITIRVEIFDCLWYNYIRQLTLKGDLNMSMQNNSFDKNQLIQKQKNLG